MFRRGNKLTDTQTDLKDGCESFGRTVGNASSYFVIGPGVLKLWPHRFHSGFLRCRRQLPSSEGQWFIRVCLLPPLRTYWAGIPIYRSVIVHASRCVSLIYSSASLDNLTDRNAVGQFPFVFSFAGSTCGLNITGPKSLLVQNLRLLSLYNR